ncbi:Na(+)/H(+) exchange regulatory cofactor NHE-RF3 [Cyclopterus lumpus]|uniref:Na(+)/H(+) exchange regulatory cofactor NHE-RF3 n=1 Tax=Cyclopterus lumpus TaxID=8103 RepID=UPI001485DD74|nr:Na(+)/H(+) exchange regulatory cofactor NHE-RF3 [Cyclopterus lumpus]XP_034417640.1 Na(+)/H(+) exchange regulatory cofactor NHE-RF3 [Cyclopterus lumpus]
MAGYKPRVISLTKRPGDSFGFYLRVERGVDGHLIRCLEMGGPAELAGMKDGDRILRVNGTFVDGLPHSEVVDMVKNSGVSVTFHTLEEAPYAQAKAKGVNLSDPQSAPVANGGPEQALYPKLCYLVKLSSGYGFSIRSVIGEQGLFMTEVVPGGVADRAGVSVNDRLLEINGENVEGSTHDQVVDTIKLAGGSIMFLLVDEETDRHYQNKHTKIGARLATAKYLPHKPRVIDMTKGPDGYGFLLKEMTQIGHITKDIDRGSPAERAGLKEMDRLVAVDGKEVDSFSHEQVVDKIKQSGNQCRLLVVDKDTDQMYKQGNVSPMVFLEGMNLDDSNSPPSYREALNLPARVQPSTPVQSRKEELKPKLCKMEKASTGYGFHLNGIMGVSGHYIKEVVKSGAADRAGLEEDDIVVEVNGVNAEQSSHEEVVEMIRSGGGSLEMLVANQSVYDQLRAQGVTITRLLLGGTSYAQVHTADTREEEERREARPETPAEPARERTISSSSDSFDESF